MLRLIPRPGPDMKMIISNNIGEISSKFKEDHRKTKVFGKNGPVSAPMRKF